MMTWLLLWGVAAQVEAVADIKVEVAALVAKLDSPELSERQAAEQQLEALGTDALPLLPQITNRTSGEAKIRLQRVRSVLEKQLAAKQVEGSRVTLKGSMPLEEALQKLEEQSGNRTVDFRGRFGEQATNPTIELEIENELYWRALDIVLDKASMKTYNYGGEPRTLALVSREEGELDRTDRAAYNGMFRIELTRLRSEKNLRSSRNQPLRITAEVQWEPRIVPIQLRQPLSTLKAVDDQGREMEVDSQLQELQVAAQPTVAGIEFVLPLVSPERSVRKIATFKGKVIALVPGKEETFEFRNIDKIGRKRINKAGLGVQLESVRQSQGITEVRVRVGMSGADESMQSHLDWVSSNEAYLLNADGKRVDETPNIERYASTRTEVGVAYIFPVEDIKGHTFVYKSPAAILDMDIDFELTNIELP